MANELNLTLETGLTLTAKVFSKSGTQQGSDVTMTEIVTNQYTGTFNVSGLADGEYVVLFYVGTENRGFGSLYVRAGTEVSQYIFSTIFDIITGANA